MRLQAETAGRRDYGLYIAGQWLPPRQGETFPTANPFTRTPWATISQAGPDDVAAAVAAARQAFEMVWRKTSGLERGRLMLRLADLLERDADGMALLESTDNGKVIRETRPQMLFAARIFRFYAGFTDKLWGKVIPLDQQGVFDYATWEPLGVVGLITAWNSPIALLANKLPAALAAGNCVVVKPSEHASVTTLEFSRLMEEAGFPPGVFNVITGDGRTGRALVETAGIDKISFTGSGRTGRLIAEAAGRRLVPVIMELGGKSPNIIFEDANLDRAIVGALAGIFAATGQTCIAGSRLLVQRPLYRMVVRRLAERAASIRLGNPVDPATEMGPAANEPQFHTILDHIATGKRQGGRLEAGGGPATDADLAGGLFVQPTIFSEVSSEMTLAQEEVFGPGPSVIPFDREDDAVAIANGTQFGLAAGIWTQDVNRVHRMVRAMRSGMVWVNTYRASAAQTPFGGVRQSGFGRERGEEGLREFMTTKNVMIDFSEDARDPFSVRV